MDSPDRDSNNPPVPRLRFAEPTQAHLNRTGTGIAPGVYAYGGRGGNREREHPNLPSINTDIPPVQMPHAQMPSTQMPHAQVPHAQVPSAQMPPVQMPPAQSVPPPQIPAPAPQYHPVNVPLAPPPPPPGFGDTISLGMSPGTPPGMPSETLRHAKEKIDAAIAVTDSGIGGSNQGATGFSPTQWSPNGNPAAGPSPTQWPPNSLHPLDFDLLRISGTEVNPYHLSTWEGANQSNDGSSGPVVIKLGIDNFLNWTIFIYRKIELNGWNDLVPPPPRRGKNGLPVKRERRVLPAWTPELARRQLECSTFILDHIQERYWHMITPQERDPWIMMAEISDIWCTSMPVCGRNRFYLGLQGLEIGQSRVFDYFAQFKWLYESFKYEGGRLNQVNLYTMLFRGLNSRFPDLEYHGQEPGEELNPIFNVQQVKTSLDYMRSYLADEFKLSYPEQLIISVPYQPDTRAGTSNAGPSNARPSNGHGGDEDEEYAPTVVDEDYPKYGGTYEDDNPDEGGNGGVAI